jgi:anti-sigma factor RsiW
MRRDRGSDDELLSAYVDGVTELAAEERRELDERLASDAALRDEAAATRELLGKLRELPPAAGEPDWAALERSIGEACGPEVPRSWWRRFGWRWVVPGLTLAIGAALAMLLLRAPSRDGGPGSGPGPGDDPRTQLAGRERARPAVREAAPHAEGTLALWLDGEDVEVELAAEDLPDLPWEGDQDQADLLPAADLAWIDELEGEALERAEAWLKEPPKQPARRKRS